MRLLSIDTRTKRIRRYDELGYCDFNAVLSRLPDLYEVEALRMNPEKALQVM